MARNIGKIFEDDFKGSVPIKHVLTYRPPDSAQSFGNDINLRFSKKSPFDLIMWDSQGRILYALELKTKAENSISFERTKTEHGDIHYHQIVELTKWDKYAGTICGFIIFFRKQEKTIFLKISEFNRLSKLISKKSFSIRDLDENEIEYTTISQSLNRTHYKYAVDEFLTEMRMEEL